MTCASRSYLQRCGVPAHPADLSRGHTLVQIVSPRSGQAVVHELYREGQVEKVAGQWQFAVNDSMAARTAALSGLGVVTTYRFFLEESLRNGDMVALFPDWRGSRIPVHIAWPENRQLPSKVRILGNASN